MYSFFAAQGNKGGIAVHFQIYDSTVCFVNAHLAAHKHNTQGRNQDYATICAKTRFVESAGPKMRAYDIFEHEYAFALGVTLVECAPCRLAPTPFLNIPCCLGRR